MKLLKLSLFGALVLVGIGTASAQERAAAGTVETQMTWSALSDLAKAANDKAAAVNSRVDQIVVCGRLGMLYAPASGNSNAQGCVEAKDKNSIADMTQIITSLQAINTNYTNLNNKVTNVLNCGDLGSVSSADGKSCKPVPSTSLKWRVTSAKSSCSNRAPSMPQCSGAAPGVNCSSKGQTCYSRSMPGVYTGSNGSCASSSNGPYDFVTLSCD